MNEDGKSGFLISLFNQKVFTEKLSLLMNNLQLLERMGTSAIQTFQNICPEIIVQKSNQFLIDRKVSSLWQINQLFLF